MTVETELNLVFHNGDGVAVTFPFTFPVYDEDHLKVYLQDTTTKLLVLQNTADYSVSGINEPTGGSVTMDTAPPSTNRVLIARVMPLTQDLDVLNQGGFYPANVERQLDLIEMQAQQQEEQIDRSVKGVIGEVWPDLPVAPERRGKLLAFTDDANAYPTIEYTDALISALGTILVAGAGISITVGASTITITNTAPGGGVEDDVWLLESGTSGGSAGDAEFVRDVIGAALQGVGCTITVNDPADTITITVTGAVDIEGVYDAIAASVMAGTGLIKATDDPGNTTTLSADPEYIRDTAAAMLVSGVGIDLITDDPGNTVTVNVKPDILSVVSAATVTPTFSYNQVNITAQAEGLTLANPTGTAVDGHGILIRIKDNGTSRAISYGTKYRTFSDALPTATVISKQLYIGIVYNEADDKWDVIGVRKEA